MRYRNVTNQSVPMIWFGLIFGGMGLISLVVGLYIAIENITFVSRALPVSGTVIEVTSHEKRGSKGRTKTVWDSKVQFIASDGQGVVFNTNKYFTRGQQVAVLYLPDAQHEAKLGGFGNLWGGPMMLSGIGSFFALIGLWISVKGWRRMREIERLLRTGTPIRAVVIGVNSRSSRSSRGATSRSWEVVAEGINLQGAKQRFESDYINFDPGDLVGKEVEVLLDLKNPASYYVRLD